MKRVEAGESAQHPELCTPKNDPAPRPQCWGRPTGGPDRACGAHLGCLVPPPSPVWLCPKEAAAPRHMLGRAEGLQVCWALLEGS